MHADACRRLSRFRQASCALKLAQGARPWHRGITMMLHDADVSKETETRKDQASLPVTRQEVQPKIARRPEHWPAMPPSFSPPVAAPEMPEERTRVTPRLWQEDAGFVLRMLLVIALANMLLTWVVAASPSPRMVAAPQPLPSRSAPPAPACPLREPVTLHQVNAAGQATLLETGTWPPAFEAGE